LGLFISNSNRKANAPQRVALPTPSYGSASSGTSKPYVSASFGTSSSKPYAPSFERSAPSYPDDSKQVDTAPSAPSSTYENQVQPTNYKVLLIKMCDVLDRVL
jgi:E3 ubiquitin-protein ligase RGLG